MKAEGHDIHIKDNVVVFGFGRSGTTWLAQIIAAAGLELIFEPLEPDRVPMCRSWKPLPLYYRASDTFPWQEEFTRIVAGEVRNEWTVRDNAGARRKVIKFIRANLMAEWIINRYPVRGVFIVRNPLAVVASMAKEGWSLSWKWVQGLLSDPRFSEVFFRQLPGVDELRRRKLGGAETGAVFWAIHNFIPKRIGLWQSLPLVVYEDLCKDPEALIRDLAPRLGIEVTENVLVQCHRQSFMAGSQPAAGAYDPTTAWKAILSPEEIRSIIDVVERFELQEFLDGI